MSAILPTGIEHHRSGRLGDAERSYTQLHHAQPADPEILFLLGLLSCDLGLFDTACQFLEQALAFEPVFPEARAQLSQAHRELGRAALLRGDPAAAAFVAALDLVISVDTAVAHLAAALGRPVWLLNRFDGCWRWLQGRNDSPWYATLHQFRQPAPGAWEPVVAAVTAELTVLCGRR